MRITYGPWDKTPEMRSRQVFADGKYVSDIDQYFEEGGDRAYEVTSFIGHDDEEVEVHLCETRYHDCRRALEKDITKEYSRAQS